MTVRAASLLALLHLASTSVAAPPEASPPGEEATRILGRFEAARPADADLGVFKLDWADSLAHAKARAAKEKRPIFFVSTTQLKDAGNLRTGHC